MKTSRTGLLLISLLLICAFVFNMSGCTMEVQAKNLMENISPNTVSTLSDINSQNSKVTDFAIRLFKATQEDGKNTLISPLSVLCALSMTVNGAQKETLEQMQAVLGMSSKELNEYIYTYVNSLPQSEKYKLSIANSIWFNEDERFSVNQNFLQTNADYYSADIYKAPFNSQTCKDINNWVSEKTDKMIPEILDKIPYSAVMYLINALAFEAEWSKIYEKYQVRDGNFTKEDGTKQKAEFMYATEGTYLEDEKGAGFIKYYKDGKYAFVAMLPNTGVSVSEYIASIDGEAVYTMLSAPINTTVYTAIPKFETEYSVEMSEILKAMGITDAFNPDKADFEGIGISTEGPLYINSVLHKTFVSVGEKGTKAGAVTVIEMNDGAAAEPLEPKEIYLDRPFVYMLIDCENNVPFFIGTMTDIEN